MNLIFSADENWGIGKDRRLLFRIPPDMRYFREKTIGGAVIMGRTTFVSLPEGKPLKDRINIVLTGNAASLVSGEKQDHPLRICGNLGELALCLKGLDLPADRIWVIGGAGIINLLRRYCDGAYVTRFHVSADGVDCWTENLDHADGWVMAERGAVQEWEGLAYRFDRYTNTRIEHLPG